MFFALLKLEKRHWQTALRTSSSEVTATTIQLFQLFHLFLLGVQNTSNSGIITGKLFLERVASVLPTKWKSIGLHLQLPKEIIEHIAKRHPGSPRHCYTDIFVLWRKIHSASRPVNWATLIDVLRTLGENELAQNLEDEFVKGNYSKYRSITSLPLLLIICFLNAI